MTRNFFVKSWYLISSVECLLQRKQSSVIKLWQLPWQAHGILILAREQNHSKSVANKGLFQTGNDSTVFDSFCKKTGSKVHPMSNYPS